MSLQKNRHSTSYYMARLWDSVWLYAVVIVGLLIFCVPVYYMATTSLKAETEVTAIPVHWIPHEFHPENYPAAFALAPFATYFYNSLVVAIIVVATTLFFSALAVYGFAKFNFPGKAICFLLVLSTLMIPFQILPENGGKPLALAIGSRGRPDSRQTYWFGNSIANAISLTT